MVSQLPNSVNSNQIDVQQGTTPHSTEPSPAQLMFHLPEVRLSKSVEGRSCSGFLHQSRFLHSFGATASAASDPPWPNTAVRVRDREHLGATAA